MRQRVYAKARATIEQKLVTANASQAVAVRQRNLLEDAIAEVEASYAPPAPPRAEPQHDPLDDFLHEANHEAEQRAPSHSVDEEDEKPSFSAGPHAEADEEEADGALPEAERGDSDWKFERAREKASARRSEYIERNAPREKRPYKGLIAGLIALLVIGGGGYAVWANKDKLQELASSLGRSDAPATSTDGQPQDNASAAGAAVPVVRIRPARHRRKNGNSPSA